MQKNGVFSLTGPLFHTVVDEHVCVPRYNHRFTTELSSLFHIRKKNDFVQTFEWAALGRCHFLAIIKRLPKKKDPFGMVCKPTMDPKKPLAFRHPAVITFSFHGCLNRRRYSDLETDSGCRAMLTPFAFSSRFIFSCLNA